MTTEEVALLPAGTRVYWIKNLRIQSYWVVGVHPRSNTTLILGSTYSVNTVETVHMPTERRMWYVEYEDAKATMWKGNVEHLQSINRIYFNDSKDLTALSNTLNADT